MEANIKLVRLILNRLLVGVVDVGHEGRRYSEIIAHWQFQSGFGCAALFRKTLSSKLFVRQLW